MRSSGSPWPRFKGWYSRAILTKSTLYHHLSYQVAVIKSSQKTYQTFFSRPLYLVASLNLSITEAEWLLVVVEKRSLLLVLSLLDGSTAARWCLPEMNKDCRTHDCFVRHEAIRLEGADHIVIWKTNNLLTMKIIHVTAAAVRVKVVQELDWHSNGAYRRGAYNWMYMVSICEKYYAGVKVHKTAADMTLT